MVGFRHAPSGVAIRGKCGVALRIGAGHGMVGRIIAPRTGIANTVQRALPACVVDAVDCTDFVQFSSNCAISRVVFTIYPLISGLRMV
jgi:hypothetical protein